MKKRIFWCLLMLVITLGITACGVKKVEASGINKATEYTGNNTQSEEKQEEIEQTEDDWGVQENLVTEKNDIKQRMHIKFPFLCGIMEASGKIAYQDDMSLVILDSQYKNSAVLDTVLAADEILPIYFEQTQRIIDSYRNANYKDFAFEITDKETVTINDYEMCKYAGKHTFTFKGEQCEMAFVAYATRLKGNDAAVYWMVLDETEDQSLGSVIESHADKMAESLYE